MIGRLDVYGDGTIRTRMIKEESDHESDISKASIAISVIATKAIHGPDVEIPDDIEIPDEGQPVYALANLFLAMRGVQAIVADSTLNGDDTDVLIVKCLIGRGAQDLVEDFNASEFASSLIKDNEEQGS